MRQEKEQLMFAFEELKAVELGGKNYYDDIINDPNVTNQEAKRILRAISKDEDRHARIVDEIIAIIKNNL